MSSAVMVLRICTLIPPAYCVSLCFILILYAVNVKLGLACWMFTLASTSIKAISCGATTELMEVSQLSDSATWVADSLGSVKAATMFGSWGSHQHTIILYINPKFLSVKGRFLMFRSRWLHSLVEKVTVIVAVASWEESIPIFGAVENRTLSSRFTAGPYIKL